MTSWPEFLALQGARFSDEARPQVTDFGAAPSAATARTDFVAPLTHLGLIAASGDEAAHFLHNQLTNDVEHLPSDTARLAAYCSPKGRMLASFLIWKSADAIHLELSADIQPLVQKRLQMFILRAKAKLKDMTPDSVILGLAGAAAQNVLAAWFPVLPAAPWAKADSAAGTLIRVADAFGAPRYQWITTPALAIQSWPALTQALTPVGPQAWRLGEIDAGIPLITQATQEKFVPQMINYEAIGGVNFKKGCYPGQEIVARSQYLGKLKRRMLPASVAAPDVSAGTEIFSAADPEQPCGMVVNAERRDDGSTDCLVEIKLAAREAANIHLGSAGGPQLAFSALPYALPDAA